MLAFIWAEAQNQIIGNQGTLPWHLPDDMHFFKEQTTGHPILAGSKTYASFGRPLPHRQNLVLTHQPATNFPAEVQVFHTPASFLQYAKEHDDELIFVVGGSQIFRLLLPEVTWLYRTVIAADVAGDTRMPPIDYHQFTLVQERPGATPAEYPHHFEIWQRKEDEDAKKFL
ncbi:dihydrofolate reductase [Fructilactobacillus myrtifloralis]|uniref:Dihydrofolate reductase n=1 Tax=Fructilactobacillus myrtifloralis TaxID=2940301 RepID=A0ABY5BQA5_9LACO|nr:dihydrofolate reductase [Fructilactobacillus myrtifloralis]USS85366.1 dihydrofolate reductase [Fructilactobacillus myrtifloralis]